MSDAPKRDCRECGDRLRVRTSKAVGNVQLRYLQCRKCGSTCRCIVQANAVFRRQR
jgi:hypothetical protein